MWSNVGSEISPGWSIKERRIGGWFVQWFFSGWFSDDFYDYSWLKEKGWIDSDWDLDEIISSSWSGKERWIKNPGWVEK